MANVSFINIEHSLKTWNNMNILRKRRNNTKWKKKTLNVNATRNNDEVTTFQCECLYKSFIYNVNRIGKCQLIHPLAVLYAQSWQTHSNKGPASVKYTKTLCFIIKAEHSHNEHQKILHLELIKHRVGVSWDYVSSIFRHTNKMDRVSILILLSYPFQVVGTKLQHATKTNIWGTKTKRYIHSQVTQRWKIKCSMSF